MWKGERLELGLRFKSGPSPSLVRAVLTIGLMRMNLHN